MPPMDDPLLQTIPIWNRIAAFWDQHIKEGNDFQMKLIMPTTDRLLGDVKGKRILDACCGNGNYARKLAERGAKVTAFDGASAFVDCAIARTPKSLEVDYRVVDATNEHGIRAIGGAFDAVVCSMAIMDLQEIDPLFRASRALLAPGGMFVFSVCHPCFNHSRMRFTAEMSDNGGTLRQKFGIAMEEYHTPWAELNVGIINQPEPHPMYHRPLHVLLRSCFAAGFVVDALEEPAFADEGGSGKNAFSWAKRPQIPPALVVRLRAASSLQ